ncbi:MAG: hypothetical protein C5B52_16210 [Bacteroidetes bacterium]|nr:MAG: hypothetical protein C5B52_16210 [Bacteroidota bacterium]
MRHNNILQPYNIHMHIKRLSRLIAIFILIHLAFNQTLIAQTGSQKDLENVINDWYTSISQKKFDHFGTLLTEDFQLMAFGSRFDKKQILEMVKDYSDITYTLKNVSASTGGDIGYITFDIEMKCNYKGKPIVGNAMETYLFKKINNSWKINTKTIVVIENKK